MVLSGGMHGCMCLDPEAVANKFYGCLTAFCGWLAGLTKQATAGYGLGIERRLTAA